MKYTKIFNELIELEPLTFVSFKIKGNLSENSIKIRYLEAVLD